MNCDSLSRPDFLKDAAAEANGREVQAGLAGKPEKLALMAAHKVATPNQACTDCHRLAPPEGPHAPVGQANPNAHRR